MEHPQELDYLFNSQGQQKQRPPMIQRLQERHLQIMDMVLAGHSNKEISQVTGLTTQTISGVIGTPLFMDQLARKRESTQAVKKELEACAMNRAKTVLEEASFDAANALVGLVKTSSNEGIKRQSANDILDRVFGDGNKGDGNRPVIIIKTEQLNLLQQIMAEDKDDVEEASAVAAPQAKGRDLHSNNLGIVA